MKVDVEQRVMLQLPTYDFPFRIVHRGGQKLVRIENPPQYLCEQELLEWMREVRENGDYDLYAQLVHVFVCLKKG